MAKTKKRKAKSKAKNKVREDTKYRTGALIVIILFAVSLIGGALNAYFSGRTSSIPKSNIVYGNLTIYQIGQILKKGGVVCIYSLSNNCSSTCYTNLEMMKSITVEFRPFVYLAIVNESYAKPTLTIYTYNNITRINANKEINQTKIVNLLCSSIPYPNLPICIARYT